jgi:hypothetical protein
MGGEDHPATAFYDTDNDGKFDLIVEAKGQGGNQAGQVYQMHGPDHWSVRDGRPGEQWLSISYLPDHAQAQKLARLLTRL